MLELYFADPSLRAVPGDPATLEYAGGIGLDAHRAMRAVLERCRDAGADLPYFADSLLSPAQVAIMRALFDAGHQPGGHEDYQRLRAILADAAARGCALAAFCD